MGIPRFAKTLMTRYPLIIGNIKNESDIPIIDNLYLDLNSTIHELSHSTQENLLALLKNKSNEEIYQQTCDLINQILQLVKPRSLLMIALDGVGPVAKISDQLKSRYIKSFNNVSEEIDNFLDELNLERKNTFDKNEISPCTNFMINFEKYLDNYIQEKIEEKSQVWKDINVILSGTNVPGEGEYKIMEEIREEKLKEKNKKYCIFSGDADFILLSLLIHEPNIVLLKKGTSTKTSNFYNYESTKENNLLYFNELIYISVLREYLDIEFCKLKPNMKFEYNIERFYDDFAFLCFLFGNDFIPALMTLDTDGNVFEFVINSYKKSIPKFNDYLTKDGIINFTNFKIFINELSLRESEYLNSKYDYFKRIFFSRKKQPQASLMEIYQNESVLNTKNTDNCTHLKNEMNTNDKLVKTINSIIDKNVFSRDDEYDLDFNEYFFHRFVEAYNNDRYKGKLMYYKNKFYIDIEKKSGKEELNKLINNYLEGLQWNLLYFKGFLNWNWNYLYNYCPLIVDLAKYDYKKDIDKTIYNNIIKLNGEPLPPYILQCLIFPSFDIIPENYNDIKNIIPDYYEYNKKVDNNGSLFPSQIIFTCPKINGNKMIQDLIDFDKSQFCKTENYNIITERYGKEYLFNINNIKSEYNRKRKNEIFEEDYTPNKVDIMFPSIESISNYQYIEGYFKRNIGGNKVIEINSLFIYIFLDEKKYKKINKMVIDNIFKEKLICYGYPLIKLGVLSGLYYNNKYYSINKDSETLKETSYQYDYEDQIKKDYEYIGLKILDPSCLIEVIPINFIDNEKVVYNYDYKYLIPLEITSLNVINSVHQEYLKNIVKLNKFDLDNLELNEELMSKEKDVFLYDDSLRKNKNNDIKDKGKNKSKIKDKKGDKKRKKPVGPSIEREITNFKFKNIDDY